MSFFVKFKAEEFCNKIIKSKKYILFTTRCDFTIIEVLIVITQVIKEDISYLSIYYPVLYKPGTSCI